MKIPYKRKSLNAFLSLGIFWLVFLIISFSFDGLSWTNSGNLPIGLMFLGTYFYRKKYGYLSIKNAIIPIEEPFVKKLKLSEIKKIRRFAGDYILKTDKKELSINTQAISPSSLTILDTELEKHQATWT